MFIDTVCSTKLTYNYSSCTYHSILRASMTAARLQELSQLILAVDKEYYQHDQHPEPTSQPPPQQVIVVIGRPHPIKQIFFRHLAGPRKPNHSQNNYCLPEFYFIKERGFYLTNIPGFKLKENQPFAMISACYSLHKILSRTSKAKFLYLMDINDMRNPHSFKVDMDNLLRLFNWQKLNDCRTEMMRSICLVVFGAKPDQSEEEFERSSQQLKAEYSRDSASDCHMLLESIIRQKRVKYFYQAVEEEPALANYTQIQNWQWFNFASFCNYKDAIMLPVELQQANALCSGLVPKRRQDILTSIQCLKGFLKKATETWNEDAAIDYQKQFETVQNITNAQNYLQEDYSIFAEAVSLAHEGQYKRRYGLEIFQGLQSIYKLNAKVVEIYENILDTSLKLQGMQQTILQLFKQFRKTFSRNQQQAQAFTSLIFLNSRFIAEIKALFIFLDSRFTAEIKALKLTAQCDFHVEIDIRNSLNHLFQLNEGSNPRTIEGLRYQFFILLTETPKQQQDKKILSGRGQDQKMTQSRPFYDECIAQIKDPVMREAKVDQNLLSIYKSLIQFELRESSRAQKRNQYLNQFNSYKKALQILNQIQEMKSPSEQKKLKEYMQFKTQQIYTKIAMLAKRINYFSVAIKIFECLQSVNSIVECYEEYLKSEKNIVRRFQILQGFIDFLFKYGKKERYFALHERAIEEYYFYPDQVLKLKKSLSKNFKDEIVIYKGLNLHQAKIQVPDELLHQLMFWLMEPNKKQHKTMTEDELYQDGSPLKK